MNVRNTLYFPISDFLCGGNAIEKDFFNDEDEVSVLYHVQGLAIWVEEAVFFEWVNKTEP